MKIDHKESYKDFGKQFLVDSDIGDFWGSEDMLKDCVTPFKLETIKGKTVMEVGSGSGRILKNLIKFDPKKIISIEPSEAIQVAKKNNEGAEDKIVFFNIKGEDLDIENCVDVCFSLGVIHHIPDAKMVVHNIHKSLKTHGKCVLWVYGFEGNEFYIFIFNNIRRLTRVLPDIFLRQFCKFLNFLCSLYILLCYMFPLPLKDYLFNVFRKCSWEKRNYIIFDQLNPSYAKYYKKNELENLMFEAGFADTKIYRRHNYSWTVIGEK